MAISKSSFIQGEYWRAITALLAHADMRHLLSNSYMFFIMSTLLTSYYGWKAHPFYTLPAAIFTNVATVWFYPPNVQLLGASGWVYVLAGMWLALFLLTERRYRIRSRILRVLGVSLVVLFPSTFEPNVSYLAHAIGYFCGVSLGAIFFLVNKQWIRSFEVYKPIIEDPSEVDLGQQS